MADRIARYRSALPSRKHYTGQVDTIQDTIILLDYASRPQAKVMLSHKLN